MTLNRTEPPADTSSLPFPLLFAERLPEGFFDAPRSPDVGVTLARWLGKAGPTGRADTVLVITDVEDHLADLVLREIVGRGVPVCRLHTQDILGSVNMTAYVGDETRRGSLRLPACDVDLEDVRSVWLRRPPVPLSDSTNRARRGPVAADESVDSFVGIEGDAAIQGLFAALGEAFWVSDPDALAAAENKLANLRIAESLGLAIPRTLVTNEAERVLEFFEGCHGQVIVKTLRAWMGSLSGELKGVWTSRVLPHHLEQVDQVRFVPCLLQEYVPKDIEVRVTVIGRQVFAAEIHSQRSAVSQVDWRHFDLSHTPHYPHQLPPDVEAACLGLLDRYHLNFGAIDLIRRPDSQYVFLELNPNGQWYWIEQMTGMPLLSTMADLLIRGSLA